MLYWNWKHSHIQIVSWCCGLQVVNDVNQSQCVGSSHVNKMHSDLCSEVRACAHLSHMHSQGAFTRMFLVTPFTGSPASHCLGTSTISWDQRWQHPSYARFGSCQLGSHEFSQNLDAAALDLARFLAIQDGGTWFSWKEVGGSAVSLGTTGFPKKPFFSQRTVSSYNCLSRSCELECS